MNRLRILLVFGLALPGLAGAAEDVRQLAPLPEAAAATLRAEMRDNLRALNEILELLAADRVKEAGTVAEKELGLSAMGRHRSLPMDARPGPHMPPAMHGIGMEGHKAASAFGRAAADGDRAKALAALPAVTAGCVACHHAYRIR